MSKVTLDDVVRDLNFFEDGWTICAGWPWTPKSEACIARTQTDLDAAESRDLVALMDAALARELVDGMEPRTWVSTIVYHAEHSHLFRVPRPNRPFGKPLSLVRLH